MDNVKKRGFTLIELLVVIAIIGLLSSIVLASLTQARKKAVDSRIIQEVEQIQNALELYKADFGHYPLNGDNVQGTVVSLAGSNGYSHIVPGGQGNIVTVLSKYLPITKSILYSTDFGTTYFSELDTTGGSPALPLYTYCGGKIGYGKSYTIAFAKGNSALNLGTWDFSPSYYCFQAKQ